jgi:hypothetical protein
MDYIKEGNRCETFSPLPQLWSLVNNEYLWLFLSFPRKRESRVLSEIWIPDQVGNDRKVIIHQSHCVCLDARA